MLTKKHIEFEDIDGFKHEMDVYFHLSFDDVVSLFDNGLQEKINKLSGSDATLADQKAVIDMLLRKSYGFRRVVNDIPTFVKGTDEEWEFFKSSGAYDSFMTSLVFGGTIDDFVTKLLPKDLLAEASKANAKRNNDATNSYNI